MVAPFNMSSLDKSGVNISGIYNSMPSAEVLSPYSRRICGLVSQGFTSQEIAEKIDSNSAAVDVMVSRAMQKVGVKTRAGLAVWYVVSTVFTSSSFA